MKSWYKTAQTLIWFLLWFLKTQLFFNWVKHFMSPASQTWLFDTFHFSNLLLIFLRSGLLVAFRCRNTGEDLCWAQTADCQFLSLAALCGEKLQKEKAEQTLNQKMFYGPVVLKCSARWVDLHYCDYCFLRGHHKSLMDQSACISRLYRQSQLSWKTTKRTKCFISVEAVVDTVFVKITEDDE